MDRFYRAKLTILPYPIAKLSSADFIDLPSSESAAKEMADEAVQTLYTESVNASLDITRSIFNY